MPNPYPTEFATGDGKTIRIDGEVTFTDPANQPGGGGGGQVNSVTAGDSSITVAGTVTDPTVAVASGGITAAKIGALAVGSAAIAASAVTTAKISSGAASSGQLLTADGAGGVSFANNAAVASVAAADTSVVVGGTATAPTIRTNTLDVIAADHPPAANWSNNSKKITGLANGTVASDAAAFGQIPAALPPNGSAGGDLSGTYPNPTVAAVQGVAVSGTAPSTNQVLTASDATHAAWATPASAATDGWISTSDTWTYASATTFTISGVDRTAQLSTGTFVKLTQTTAKYFVVVSSSFSTNTTVTITGGSDYTLANASITAPSYSYSNEPQGWPGWFNFSPSVTGTTSDTSTARFAVYGRNCYLDLWLQGTSNSTSKGMTLPIAIASGVLFGMSSIVRVEDNGSVLTNPGLISGNASSASPVIVKDLAANTWTASGTWRVTGQVFYPI